MKIQRSSNVWKIKVAVMDGNFEVIMGGNLKKKKNPLAVDLTMFLLMALYTGLIG